MTYVDGFVLQVPKKKVKPYQKFALSMGKLWMKYGALSYKECVADDLDVKKSGLRTFQEIAKPKKNEVIFFSYIEFKSKKHRDTVNKKVMAESMKMNCDDFDHTMCDMKRMSYGGFKALVDL